MASLRHRVGVFTADSRTRPRWTLHRASHRHRARSHRYSEDPPRRRAHHRRQRCASDKCRSDVEGILPKRGMPLRSRESYGHSGQYLLAVPITALCVVAPTSPAGGPGGRALRHSRTTRDRPHVTAPACSLKMPSTRTHRSSGLGRSHRRAGLIVAAGTMVVVLSTMLPKVLANNDSASTTRSIAAGACSPEAESA